MMICDDDRGLVIRDTLSTIIIVDIGLAPAKCNAECRRCYSGTVCTQKWHPVSDNKSLARPRGQDRTGQDRTGCSIFFSHIQQHTRSSHLTVLNGQHIMATSERRTEVGQVEDRGLQ